MIAELGLEPHPEGGFYRETFRSPLIVHTDKGPRSASTAIFFLLPAGAFSRFHRCFGDEVWHFYDGDPLELHVLEGNEHRVARLDRTLPQAVVPSGAWQAARCLGGRHSLVGCTVAPGFEFADFELADL